MIKLIHLHISYKIGIGKHMRLSAIKDLLSIFKNCLSCEAMRGIWKILETQVQLILIVRGLVMTCLSLKGKIIQRKSHLQSVFIWETCLVPWQIINEIELSNH